jgi:hypothetical protein
MEMEVIEDALISGSVPDWDRSPGLKNGPRNCLTENDQPKAQKSCEERRICGLTGGEYALYVAEMS